MIQSGDTLTPETLNALATDIITDAKWIEDCDKEGSEDSDADSSDESSSDENNDESTKVEVRKEKQAEEAKRSPKLTAKAKEKGERTKFGKRRRLKKSKSHQDRQRG